MADFSGKFVISLDFELLWGVMDIKNNEAYNENLLGVHTAMPKMLQLFEKYNIDATFATVGFLFAKDKDELFQYLPKKTPSYHNKDLSPYESGIKYMQNNPIDDKLYFARDLVDLLKSKKNHEIACHTFSHYYCLEAGQSNDEFKEDIKTAIEIAKDQGVSLDSIVFPRNQCNNDYLQVIEDSGMTSFRGTETAWYYNPSTKINLPKTAKMLRLLDSYINISGHNTYLIPGLAKSFPFNIPSSRFLRPHVPILMLFNALKLKRIKKSMTFAAKNNEVYHLWWHPHNFGTNQNENFLFLEQILIHYQALNKKYRHYPIKCVSYKSRV